MNRRSPNTSRRSDVSHATAGSASNADHARDENRRIPTAPSFVSRTPTTSPSATSTQLDSDPL
jgi:hypothetical protein